MLTLYDFRPTNILTALQQHPLPHYHPSCDPRQLKHIDVLDFATAPRLVVSSNASLELLCFIDQINSLDVVTADL
jgi:hypothetical protein